jgi:hypothetical protein
MPSTLDRDFLSEPHAVRVFDSLAGFVTSRTTFFRDTVVFIPSAQLGELDLFQPFFHICWSLICFTVFLSNCHHRAKYSHRLADSLTWVSQPGQDLEESSPILAFENNLHARAFTPCPETDPQDPFYYPTKPQHSSSKTTLSSP